MDPIPRRQIKITGEHFQSSLTTNLQIKYFPIYNINYPISNNND